jgi:AcrR family transcriptional regulator
MSDVIGHTEMDVRERILVTAERLFREIGYQKTTVADVARALRMSPANVYRFFDSKKSIHLGVVRRLMGQVEAESQAIAQASGSAAKRLRELLTTIHRMNADRYVADAKMHEMFAVAMEENWDVCGPHIECITGVIAKVITDGIVAGEFRVSDANLAAACTFTAMIRFFHPQLIAENADMPGPTLDQMIDFVIAALQPRDREGRPVIRRP